MKNELRKKSLAIGKKLNTEELSKKILFNLSLLDEYRNSNNILCYYPLKYEVNTLNLLKNNDKVWYLPRVKGNELEICRYEPENLSCGSFNIMEPKGEIIKDLTTIDMIIVPAVAADKNGYRLGWGKGYYDRFIFSLKNKPIIVFLIYDKLLFDTVYPDSYDMKCDILISDKEILRIEC